MRTDVVHVIADDRENAGGVIEELRKLESVAVQVRRLTVGDFVVEDRFAVERKTVTDFGRSILDGRLFSQATALAKTGRGNLMILEGRGDALEIDGMSRESLQGAFITVTAFFGIAMLRARDAAESAWLITCLARQAQRVAHGGLSRFGYRPKGRRARQLFILQGLPGIGPERAERLLTRFGSVEAVATAAKDQLASVEGIGATTAKRIRWILEGEENAHSI